MSDQTPADVAEVVTEADARRSRRAVVSLLIVLGTIVMVLSTLNTWVERQLLNTDSWVRASTQLLENDEIREELSLQLVNALYENVEVGPAIDEQLPEQLQGLGGPLAGVLRDPLINTASTLLESEPVRVLWKEANRNAHEAVLAILEDDVARNVSTSDGKVVIDLGALLFQVGEQIGLPQGVLESIPEDAGQFQVVDSDELASAQNAVKVIKVLSVVFFLLVVILFGAAVYLADNWRRVAARNVGLAVALGGFVVAITLRLGTSVVADTPDTPGGRAAADSVLAIATSLLRQSAWSEILIGLLIAFGASLVGPARYAQWVRRYAAWAFQRSAVATWIGLAVLALVVLVWSPFSARDNWLTALIVVMLVAVGIEALRRTSLAEHPAHTEQRAEAVSADAGTPAAVSADAGTP